MTCRLPLTETAEALLRLALQGIALLRNPLSNKFNLNYSLALKVNNCYIALLNNSGFMSALSSLSPSKEQEFRDTYTLFSEYIPPSSYSPLGVPSNLHDFFPNGVPSGYFTDLSAGHPNGIDQWGLPPSYEDAFSDLVSVIPDEYLNPAYRELLDILQIPNLKIPNGLSVWFTKRVYFACSLDDITPLIISELSQVGAPVTTANYRTFFNPKRLAALTNLSNFVPVGGFRKYAQAPTYSGISSINPTYPIILNGEYNKFKQFTDSLSGAKTPILGLANQPLDFQTATSNASIAARIRETSMETANPDRRTNSVFGIFKGKADGPMGTVQEIMEILEKVLCVNPATALAAIIDGTIARLKGLFEAVKEQFKALMKEITLANIANSLLAYLFGNINISLQFAIASVDACDLFNDLMDGILTDDAKNIIDTLANNLPAPPIPNPPFGVNQHIKFDL